jgi:hypothetical protein
MAPTTRASTNRVTSRVVALPEFWTLVAEHSGLVGAWRLTGVCVAAREGAKAWLRTLPGLVVCGGQTAGGEITSGVWRLDLGELRWERMSDLALARGKHACCAVRGGVVVLGGQDTFHTPGENEFGDCLTASVEILGYDSEAEKQISSPHLKKTKIAPRLLPFFSDTTRFLFSVTKTLLLPSQNHN